MNTATIITATIPTFAVLLGILFNRQEISLLRTDIAQIRVEMIQLRKDIHSDMVQLRDSMVQLRDSIHRDMIGLHERLAVVEAKQVS